MFENFKFSLDSYLLKSLAIILVGLVGGFLFAYYFYLVSFTGAFDNYFIYLLCGLFVFAFIFCLEPLVFRERETFLKIILANSLIIFLPFILAFYVFQESLLSLFLLWLIVFLLFLAAGYRMRWEERNLLEVKWGRITARGLGIFFWGVIVFCSVIFFFSPQSKDIELFVSQKSFNSILDTSNSVIKLMVPNFNWDLTVDEFLSHQIVSQFGREPSSWQLAMARDEFQKKFGLKAKEDEKFRDLAYNLLLAQFEKTAPQTKKYITIGVIVAVALVFKGLSVPFSWLIKLIGWFVLEILIASEFIKKHREEASMERYSLE